MYKAIEVIQTQGIDHLNKLILLERTKIRDSQDKINNYETRIRKIEELKDE